MCSGLLRNVRERGQADRIFLSGKWIWGYRIAKINYYLIIEQIMQFIFLFISFKEVLALGLYLLKFYCTYVQMYIHMYICTQCEGKA